MTPSTTTDILLTSILPSYAQEGLNRCFNIHKLQDIPDIDVFLGKNAHKIKGIAASGDSVIGDVLLSRLPYLEIVSTMAAGYESIDTEACHSRGIIVTNAAEALYDEVADTAIGLLLMTVRELSSAERYLRSGRWASEGNYPLSTSLKGRTVGILGLGRIGKAIAKRVLSLGLPVSYHNRKRLGNVAYHYYEDLISLAQAVDILIVSTPGGTSTYHMVNAAVLEALGPNGFLINISRGSVVDEMALVEALRSNTIRSCGLDVFEKEPHVHPYLIEREDVVLLPHVGSASVETRKAMADLMIDNLVRWFDGKNPLTPVPETPIKHL